jgi:predicted phosphodiesterase
MKYCIISDVHANWPALEAISKDVNDIDAYLFLGDAIGLLGYPSEVVDFIKKETVKSIKGNHDISVLENHEGHVNSVELSKFEYQITHNALSSEQKEWMSSLNSYDTIEDENILMAHAQPFPELSSGLSGGGVRKKHYTKIASKIDSEKYSYVLLGHTHSQAKLDCSEFGHNVEIINPGSVGQPFMGEKAHYATLNTDSNESQLKSVDYNATPIKEKLESLCVPIKWWMKTKTRTV